MIQGASRRLRKQENFKAHCVSDFKRKSSLHSLPAGLAELLLVVFVFKVNPSHRKIFPHFLLFLHYSGHYVETARELFHYLREPPADWNNYVVIRVKRQRLFLSFSCYCSQFSSRSRQHISERSSVGVRLRRWAKFFFFCIWPSAGSNQSVNPWLLSSLNDRCHCLRNDREKNKYMHTYTKYFFTYIHINANKINIHILLRVPKRNEDSKPAW